MAKARDLYIEDRRLAYLILLPSAVLLVLLFFVPALKVVMMSFQDVSPEVGSGPFVGLENFRWAIKDKQFLNALLNTLLWTFGSVSLEMLIGLGIALLLHQSFFLRGGVRALILSPYLIPTVVAVLVWRYMFHDIFGVINYVLTELKIISTPLPWINSVDRAMLSVILVGTWKFFPFCVIALLGILQSIPLEQYEAARIDGARAWQQFWMITLPHIMPIFLLTALLRTIWTFHKFDIIYLLTGGGPLNATTTLPLFVYFKGFVDFQMGRAAAVALIAFGILAIFLIIYVILLKRVEARL